VCACLPVCVCLRAFVCVCVCACVCAWVYIVHSSSARAPSLGCSLQRLYALGAPVSPALLSRFSLDLSTGLADPAGSAGAMTAHAPVPRAAAPPPAAAGKRRRSATEAATGGGSTVPAEQQQQRALDELAAARASEAYLAEVRVSVRRGQGGEGVEGWGVGSMDDVTRSTCSPSHPFSFVCVCRL
jgi:hypothetical protein